MSLRVCGPKSERLINFIARPLVGGMVMNHDDSAFNCHPNPARGCAESVNWNLKGAEKWFAYLQQHQSRFRIRIKRDMKIAQANGRGSPAQNFFRSLPLATYCSFIGARLVCGHRLYVTGMRLPAGEYVMIVSNDESDQILED